MHLMEEKVPLANLLVASSKRCLLILKIIITKIPRIITITKTYHLKTNIKA